MGLASMSRSLVPLVKGGGLQAQRPFGVPALVTGPLPYAQSFFEDFTAQTIIADPTLGNPAWVATEIVGTTGSVGINQGASAFNTNGIVQIISGTTSGNCMALDHGGVSATVGNVFLRNSTTTSNLWQVRCHHNGSVTAGAQSGRFGFGFVAGALISIGTDWITDPDVTLLNSQAMVIHRDGAAAYGGAARGDIVLRVYSTTTSTSLVLVSAAQQTTDGASFPYKFEVLNTGTTVSAWVNGVAIGSIACTTWGSNSQRFSAQTMATSAAARQLNIDSIFAENQGTASR